MQAETNDGNPRRHFVEYDHPDGLYTLEAHKVTKKTEGTVTTPGNVNKDAREGDVLVRNGNYYEVYSADAWDELGLEAQEDQKDLEPFTVDEEVEPEWDPSEHSAAEVRRYLRNENYSEDERNRVADAERANLNRSSAFPK